MATVVALLVVAPTVAAGAVVDADRSGSGIAAASAANDHNVMGHPGLDISVPDTDFRPGEEGALQVVLLNDGNVTSGSLSNPGLEERVTTARAVRVSVGEPRVGSDDAPEGAYPSLADEETDEVDAPITVETNERAIARLPDGSSAPVEFRLDVDRNAEPGTYELPVNVSYNYTQSIDPETSEYNTTTATRNFTVEVTVEETAQFRVTDVESSARIGATGTVDVTLKNTGSAAARNASVSLASQNADVTFGQSTASSRYVGGAWEPGETRTVSYRVTAAGSASQQRYAFDATVNYEDADGAQTQSQPVSLGVTPAPEQTFSVVSAEHDVAVADDGPVELTVRNDGPIDVRDASVTVTSGSPALNFGGSTSASRYVGTWGVNETRTITVEATATPDAETRSYSLRASVSYEDGEGDPGESGTLQFGVQPDSEVEYEFEASDVTSNLRVGEEGTLSGTLTNVGDERARSVVVVFETESQNVSPLEREYSVGDLGVNQSKNFTFDVEMSEAAEAGPRQFTLRPTYRDCDDERREAESFDVRQRVREQRDVFDVAASNATVERGAGRVLEVTVTNTRDEPVSDVSAAMFADDPISVDDGEAYADRIPAGDSETFVFEVSADSGALTKSYPVELDFEYEEADGDTKLSSGYTVAVDVTEPEDDGGGLPIGLIAVALVAVVGAVAGYLRFGR